MSSRFVALIRTHHITSRKKVATLKKAADKLECHVLLRSGSYPGMMYCEGTEERVSEWIATVKRLRYKDYRLMARPQDSAMVEDCSQPKNTSGLEEVASVSEFGSRMERNGLREWYRKAMGYVQDDE
ncbi:hypothetical protein EJ05DRAFT_503714 [Pseudovirgaria hyperparasitica]|uniref:Uncharacterized protein n=1 Tax=Pseudovirgaria hyperparasitica TaxID=470096 RepID=A0A6A6VZL2_9PEZI|nr:uncharacterized protein EJ05DRAFT_503714 [Pseudovirgaria hyperparasitica]KAF2754767.1 hypothetical protein EJ05DRAFT_503714 [Pseudovirgaria hyperparasitica]